MMLLKNRVLILILVFLGFTLYASPVKVSVRAYDHPGYTRVVLQGDKSFKFSYIQSEMKDSLIFELSKGTEFTSKKVKSTLISQIIPLPEEGKVIFRFSNPIKLKSSFVLQKPFRVVFDIVKIPNQKAPEKRESEEYEGILSGEKTEDPVKPEAPVKQKRAVIETICIDPGHGGGDLGAVGLTGLSEKYITLKVSRRLKSIVEEKLGLRVIITRDSDKEVSLNRRAAIANNQKAQLFVSIHVNSSFRSNVRGPETFYVSLKATDSESYELAKKENQEEMDGENQVTEPQNDDLKMILWNMAQTEHIKESSKLAEFIQQELNALMNTRNRGVKQAPFRVLMRSSMPAVLVEIAFISNKDDEKLLSEGIFLNKVSSAIYRGLRKFINYYNSLD